MTSASTAVASFRCSWASDMGCRGTAARCLATETVQPAGPLSGVFGSHPYNKHMGPAARALFGTTSDH